MAKKKKYYCVWEGRTKGVFDNWEKTKNAIDAYPNARFKSFQTLEEAEIAFKNEALVPKQDTRKNMFYVVWEGHEAGVYTSWEKTQAQLKGFKKPKFKAFGSQQLADKAFEEGYEKYKGNYKKTRDMSSEEFQLYGEPLELSICVDAACDDKGQMEYRGVFTLSSDEIFHAGPYAEGSNNVGEFLGLVHALAWSKKNHSNMCIYSDSKIALNWVKEKKISTTVKNAYLQSLIKRALLWLQENNYDDIPLLKWQTKFWGEIPADFGRK